MKFYKEPFTWKPVICFPMFAVSKRRSDVHVFSFIIDICSQRGIKKMILFFNYGGTLIISLYHNFPGPGYCKLVIHCVFGIPHAYNKY